MNTGTIAVADKEESEEMSGEDSDNEESDYNSDIDTQFTKENGQHDVTLIIENHKIQLSRSVLCIASPVFRTMFQSKFKEQKEEEIPLPGKSYDDFVDFLHCIYPDSIKYVTGTNVYKILPLASEYQVQTLLDRCEGILIALLEYSCRTKAKKVFQHIQLADTYGLEKLKSASILIASELKLEDIEYATEKYPIRDELMEQIKDLALKRYELNKHDEKQILSYISGRQFTSFLSPVKEFINSAKDTDYKAEVLRAMRLCERYFPKDNTLLQVVKETKKRKYKDESENGEMQKDCPDLALDDQKELLPESLKQKLPTDFPVDHISKVLMKE